MSVAAKKQIDVSQAAPADSTLRRHLPTAVRRLIPTHIPIAIKLAAVIILLVVFGMGALGAMMVSNQRQVMYEQLQDFGLTAAMQLAEIASELILSEDNLGLSVMTAKLAQSDKVQGAAVHSDTGERLAGEGAELEDEELSPIWRYFAATSADHYQWSWVDRRGEPERLVSFVAPVKYRDVLAGYAIVTLSASLMDEALQRARNAILYATVLMSLVASILAFFMSRRLSQPIHDLMEVTSAIDRGNLEVRIRDRRNDEIGLLIDRFNNMAEGLLRKSQVEQIFSRYVSKKVADQVLANLDEIRLGSRHVESTVLFADIVGFTSIAERLEPAEVSDLLNEYFTYISEACKLYQGSVDKFIGDCAMLVFGAVDEDQNHPFHAVACGVLIQKLAEFLNVERMRQGKPRVDFRIGINCGSMLAGNLGSNERMEYTVVGDAVNMASRLSSVACAGQIIIQDELLKRPGLDQRVLFNAHQTIAIRGKSNEVTTYNVYDVHAKYQPVLKANLREVLAVRSSKDV